MDVLDVEKLLARSKVTVDKRRVEERRVGALMKVSAKKNGAVLICCHYPDRRGLA